MGVLWGSQTYAAVCAAALNVMLNLLRYWDIFLHQFSLQADNSAGTHWPLGFHNNDFEDRQYVFIFKSEHQIQDSTIPYTTNLLRNCTNCKMLHKYWNFPTSNIFLVQPCLQFWYRPFNHHHVCLLNIYLPHVRYTKQTTFQWMNTWSNTTCPFNPLIGYLMLLK